VTYKIELKNKKTARLIAPAEVIDFLIMKSRHRIGYTPYTGDLYSSIITKGGNFHPMFTSLIKSFLKDTYPAKILVDKRISEMIKPTIDAEVEQLEGEHDYRDWQVEALEKTFTHGRGIIDVGTGGGKTMYLAGLCKSIMTHNSEHNILIVVPTSLLIKQTEDELIGFGLTPSVVAGSRVDDIPEKGALVLALSAKLIAKKGKETYADMFKNYDVVIMDEVHMYARTSGASAINKFLTELNTFNKIGLTGSVPTDVGHRWSIMKLTGHIIYKVKAYELREQGLIADVKIRCLVFEHGLNPKHFFKSDKELKALGEEWRPTQGYNDEKEYLLNHQERLDAISKVVSSSNDGNIVILVDTVDALEKYTAVFKEKFPDRNVDCIYGENDDDHRKRVIDRMESHSDNILIAMAKIFHVGLSIKNIKYLMFILIGKAETKIVQSIGRSVRLHKDKDEAIIYDISDDTRYSSLHFLERLNIYKKQRINYVTRKINTRLLCKS
jgi:superfamily II DNA or RNA helicase